MTLFDTEGTGVFAFRSVLVPMDRERLSQRAILSIYRLPWCGQFCFWLDPGPRRDQILVRLQEGFQATSGVPQRILVRPVRPFGVCPQPEVTWLRTFRRFCAYYRCHPEVCGQPVRPHTPWFETLRSLICNTDWTSLEQCQQELNLLSAYLSKDEQPDLASLLSLPAQPFAAHDDTPCRVAGDGFLRYAGDYYSMPPHCTGSTVWVRRTQIDTQLRFYSEDETLVTQHAAGPGQGKVHLRLEHFGLTPPDQSQLIRAWRVCFPEDERFLGHLLAQRKLGAPQTLRTILDLTKRFRRPRLREVFQQCEQYNNYSHRFIQGLLDSHEQPSPVCTNGPTPTQGCLF